MKPVLNLTKRLRTSILRTFFFLSIMNEFQTAQKHLKLNRQSFFFIKNAIEFLV